MDTEYKKPTRVKWNYISEVGKPPNSLRFVDEENGVERQFLVKGEYSIECCYLFHDGSGFDMPEHSTDEPLAWAVIDGF